MSAMTGNEPMILQRSSLAPAARMCARAFGEAPHIAHFFSDGTRRERDSAALFEMRIRYGLLRGEVHVTSSDLEGIAVWFPSSQAHMTMWGQICAGGIHLQRMVGSEAIARMTRVGKHNDQLRERHVPDRYMFLSILAIDPEHQHRGHATRLVQGMLSCLDRDGLSCYAETTEGELLAFYQRLGFEPGDESTVPGTDLIVWPMVRPPAS